MTMPAAQGRVAGSTRRSPYPRRHCRPWQKVTDPANKVATGAMTPKQGLRIRLGRRGGPPPRLPAMTRSFLNMQDMLAYAYPPEMALNTYRRTGPTPTAHDRWGVGPCLLAPCRWPTGSRSPEHRDDAGDDDGECDHQQQEGSADNQRHLRPLL